MKGKIALEEAIQLPELIEESKFYVPANDPAPGLLERLVDIHGPTRLGEMDKWGVGMMVLSLTSPGCQARADPKEAEALATRANDYMAAEVAKNPTRFQGLASLSMHDAEQAATELKRAVKELGLVGVMLNDFQSSGPDGDTMLFYDNDRYDPFWKMVEELDVPVYMHPRMSSPSVTKLLWADRPGLGTQVFSTGVSIHLMGLMSNGIFDKFPKVQFVVGHLGENIPADLWRIDHWWEKGQRVRMKAKHPVYHYFKNNIWITTSGHYSTDTLLYCMKHLGTDRILFSIDTAYEYTKEGATWWDDITEISEEDKVKMGRDNAIKLYKLKNVPLT